MEMVPAMGSLDDANHAGGCSWSDHRDGTDVGWYDLSTDFSPAHHCSGSCLWGGAYVVVYRDPDRVVPDEPGLVLSPADGSVIYIRRLEAGGPLRSEKNGAMIILDEIRDTAFAREALWQVGISMVFTDVHVNRAPIQGILIFVCHKPGKFLSLRREEALNLNERQTLIIENHSEDMQVMLVQIASRLVRQIVAYVQDGQSVDRGQRVGMIYIRVTSGFVSTYPQSNPARSENWTTATIRYDHHCTIQRIAVADMSYPEYYPVR